MLYKLDYFLGGVWIVINLELKKGVQCVYFFDIGVNQYDFFVVFWIVDYYVSQIDVCVFVFCNLCG